MYKVSLKRTIFSLVFFLFIHTLHNNYGCLIFIIISYSVSINVVFLFVGENKLFTKTSFTSLYIYIYWLPPILERLSAMSSIVKIIKMTFLKKSCFIVENSHLYSITQIVWLLEIHLSYLITCYNRWCVNIEEELITLYEFVYLFLLFNNNWLLWLYKFILLN